MSYDEEALRLIRARAVDLRREVLLADCAAPAPPGGDSATASAAITHDSPERVVVAASTDSPGYLVLADTWFPGWTAAVDGRARPVERADHAFRAVRLEPGRHEVEFRYWPRSVQLGLAVSAVAALAALIVAWPGRRPAERS